MNTLKNIIFAILGVLVVLIGDLVFKGIQKIIRYVAKRRSRFI